MLYITSLFPSAGWWCFVYKAETSSCWLYWKCVV